MINSLGYKNKLRKCQSQFTTVMSSNCLFLSDQKCKTQQPKDIQFTNREKMQIHLRSCDEQMLASLIDERLFKPRLLDRQRCC